MCQCNGESAAATSKRTKSVMTDATFTEKLVLASTSPRRAEILRAVGWPFETLAPNVDETRALDEDAVAYVRRLAQAKACGYNDFPVAGMLNSCHPGPSPTG